MKWIVLTLCLAGCATQRWVKPGATDRDYKMDEAACKAQAYQGYGGNYTALSMAALNMQYCLEGKGWVAVSN